MQLVCKIMMDGITTSTNIVAILTKNKDGKQIFCQNCNYVKASVDTVHH